jgi:hypothetical protein
MIAALKTVCEQGSIQACIANFARALITTITCYTLPPFIIAAMVHVCLCS